MRATYRRIPDINILPQEYRPRALSSLEWALIALLLVGVVLLPVSLRSFMDTRDTLAALESEQQRLVVATGKFSVQSQAADKLRQDMAALQVNLDKSKKVTEVLKAQRTDWGALLATTLVSVPSGIELTAVVRAPKVVTVEGVSRTGYPDIALYYNQLRAAPGVSKVTINKTLMIDGKDQGSLLSFNMSVTLVND